MLGVLVVKYEHYCRRVQGKNDVRICEGNKIKGSNAQWQCYVAVPA